MNTSYDNAPLDGAPRDADFDARLCRTHAHAVEQLSARTRAQLSVRRSQGASRDTKVSRHPGWTLASACAVGVLGLGLAWRLQSPSAPTSPQPAAPAAVQTGVDGTYAVFDESPDLYLWLASDDALLALE